MFHRFSLVAAAVLILAGRLLLAAETASAEAAGADVSRLVRDLDAEEFAQRQEASQRLTAAGKAVFPELEKAALDGSREASGRAVEILQSHFQRGDDETKQAAQAALQRLAAGGNPGAAQRANNVLNPPPELEPQAAGPFGAVPIRAANVQIQIAANAGNANARRISVKNVNGKKEIELEENGKKTKVTDGANGGIEVEVTQKINGKETTEKIQAKDLDDLKKKNADAARIYEQFQPRGAGIQIQFGAQPGGNAPNVAPPKLPKELAERMIQGLDNQVKQLEGQAATNPAAARQIEALKERRKQFEQMLPMEEK